MTINYQMPRDEDFTKWDEDVHYSLMEVVGQYFKLMTNYHLDNNIKCVGKWDIKQDISEKYLDSMIRALHQGDCSQMYDDAGDLVLEFLYDVINEYRAIEDLKLEEFEKYCHKWDYFTVATQILSQMMTTADDERRCVNGSRDELRIAFCNAFYPEDFGENKEPPQNIIQEWKEMTLENWWMKHACKIQF